MDQALELLGDHLVALTHDDVKDSLGANDLAGRGDQRRITGILTHAGNLLQNILELILLAGVFQLLEHVGEHTARHLIQQGIGVNAQGLLVDLAVGDVLLAQLVEVSADDIQLVQVKAGVVVGALQGGDQTLSGHMRGAQREGAHGGINDICASLDALQNGHGSKTCGVMAVDIHGDLDGLFQLLDQVIAGVGLQQTGHILDADRVGTHLFQSLGVVGEVLVVMYRAQGVADAGLNVSAFLVGGLDGGLQVARIVQSVENTNDVNAVGDRLLDEVLDGVIGVGTVAQHILATEQHLQLLVGQLLAQDAQALPRILIQETDAGVKRSAAPALHREVRDFVHFGQDGAHFVHGHAGGQQRLVGITQDDLSNLNGFLSQCDSPGLSISSW